LSSLVAAVCALSSASSHALTVTELGDAGQSLASAQVTSGVGALSHVVGSIGATNDVDLFLITITDPHFFSATTVNPASGDRDTQIFLLTAAGAPVYANDDTPDGSSLLSTLPVGDRNGPLTPGRYLLGISLSGVDPANVNAQLLFAPLIASTDVRGPASSLQPASLGSFAGDGYAPIGAYDIQLTGAAAAAVPEPGTALMFLSAGLLCAVGAARRAHRAQARTTRA
jgi:hypothetical protein